MKNVIKNSFGGCFAVLLLALVFASQIQAQSMFDQNRKLNQCFVLYNGDIIQIGNECEFGSSECRSNPCNPVIGD
jgi:hypothetical protein